MDSYFSRTHLTEFDTIARGNPKLAAKFFEYYRAVFEPGAMSQRLKRLTALSVAHAVQCPYCIDAYTSGALQSGADLDQMTEATHMAAFVRANSSLLYGMQMVAQATRLSMEPPASESPSSYFSRAHLRDRHQRTDSSALDHAYQAYEDTLLSPGALSISEKALIALAVAHAIQCPYGIHAASTLCVEHSAPLEAKSEAVHIAAAIRGGASLVHGVQMLSHHDQHPQSASGNPHSHREKP